MQENFICTINKVPFPLKIFQQEKGLFYSMVNIINYIQYSYINNKVILVKGLSNDTPNRLK